MVSLPTGTARRRIQAGEGNVMPYIYNRGVAKTKTTSESHWRFANVTRFPSNEKHSSI